MPNVLIDNNTGSVTLDAAVRSLPTALGVGGTPIVSQSTTWEAYNGSLSWRNKIQNGDMIVAQRGSTAVTTDLSNPVDRWFLAKTAASTFAVSVNQAAITPFEGFNYGIQVSVTTSASPGATEYCGISQSIEGRDVWPFFWGTSAGETATLSFWVRSSITGTYGVRLSNSGASVKYTASYTINVANTWEYKVLTITAPPISSFLRTTGIGINVWFDLGSGTDAQVGTGWSTGAGTRYTVSGRADFLAGPTLTTTWVVTGVQLEVGSNPSPFEFINYQQQLLMCQRYFSRITSAGAAPFGSGLVIASTSSHLFLRYPTVMRTAPTMTYSGSGHIIVDGTGTNRPITSAGTHNYGDSTMRAVMNFSGGGGTLGNPAYWTSTAATDYVDLNADLYMP